MKGKRLHLLVAAAALSTFAFSILGCDNFVVYELLDPAGGLTVFPEAALVESGGSTTFAGQGGEPGYTYSLREPSFGTIDPVTGEYFAPGNAVRDIIEVTDAQGSSAEGIAEVIDTSIAGPLTISPTSLTINIGESYLFSASGGTGSYTFSKASGVGSVGSSGLYTAPGATTGSAVVEVDDGASSTSASVTIVDSSEPLGINPHPATAVEDGTLEFAGFGGSGAYTYSVSGPGSIIGSGADAGEYTAPSDQVGNGIATVTVADGSDTASSTVTVVPAAPTSLAADNNAPATGPKDIRLTWTDNSSVETGYVVERKGGGTISFEIVTTLSADTTTYVDTDLTPNQLYRYRVRAYATGSPTLYSAYSNEDGNTANG